MTVFNSTNMWIKNDGLPIFAPNLFFFHGSKPYDEGFSIFLKCNFEHFWTIFFGFYLYGDWLIREYIRYLFQFCSKKQLKKMLVKLTPDKEVIFFCIKTLAETSANQVWRCFFASFSLMFVVTHVTLWAGVLASNSSSLISKR